jgi:hypothetical protein
MFLDIEDVSLDEPTYPSLVGQQDNRECSNRHFEDYRD